MDKEEETSGAAHSANQDHLLPSISSFMRLLMFKTWSKISGFPCNSWITNSICINSHLDNAQKLTVFLFSRYHPFDWEISDHSAELNFRSVNLAGQYFLAAHIWRWFNFHSDPLVKKFWSQTPATLAFKFNYWHSKLEQCQGDINFALIFGTL